MFPGRIRKAELALESPPRQRPVAAQSVSAFLAGRSPQRTATASTAASAASGRAPTIDFGVYYAPSRSPPRQQHNATAATTTVVEQHHHHYSPPAPQPQPSLAAADELRRHVTTMEAKLDRLLLQQQQPSVVYVPPAPSPSRLRHVSPPRPAAAAALGVSAHLAAAREDGAAFAAGLAALAWRRARREAEEAEEAARAAVRDAEAAARLTLVEHEGWLVARRQEEAALERLRVLDAEALLRRHHAAVLRGERHREELVVDIAHEHDSRHAASPERVRAIVAAVNGGGGAAAAYDVSSVAAGRSPYVPSAVRPTTSTTNVTAFGRSVRFASPQREREAAQAAAVIRAEGDAAWRRQYKRALMNSVLSAPV